MSSTTMYVSYLCHLNVEKGEYEYILYMFPKLFSAWQGSNHIVKISTMYNFAKSAVTSFYMPVATSLDNKSHGSDQTPTLLSESKNHVSIHLYNIIYAVEEFLSA